MSTVIGAIPNSLVDAFGRMRVSEPFTQFDSKLVNGPGTNTWDDAEVSGSGTASVHDLATASQTLSVTAATAGRRVRQSHRRLTYQPGKSRLIYMTAVMGAAATDITRRVGQFDDDNGVFFEQTSSGISVVIRSSSTSGSPVNNTVAQATWSLDKLDGTGKSGVTLDLTKSQIFVIEYEWLGVGFVKFGFVIDGVLIYVHQENHVDIMTGVYMSTPNLPLRYSIESAGGGGAPAADLECICSTVISEGGKARVGQSYAVDRDATPLTTLNDADIYPLILLRAKSTAPSLDILVQQVSIICTSSTAYRWAVLINPTITGAALPAYTSVSPGAEAIVSLTTNKITAGTGIQVASGYQLTTGEAAPSIALLDSPFGYAIDGTSDVIVLAVQRLTGNTETFYASMSWHEEA